MTRFWQRRLAVMLIIGGLITAALFGLSFVVPESFPLPSVNLYAGIAGGIALAVGLFTFFATAPEDIDENARLAYLTLVGLITTLIYTTGVISSPFTLLWGAIALTAPLFGGWGILPVLLIGAGLPALQMFTGQIGFNTMWQAIALGTAPLLFGFLIKPAHRPDAGDTPEDVSYKALAKQLSQVSGKSDVVISAIGEGVLAIDGKGTIELINPAAQKIVGWGNEDAVGLNYKSILKFADSTGKEVDSAHDPVAKTFATNTTTSDNTLSIITQSEKRILASIIVSPLGQPGSGAIVVFRDITNEKLEERQQAEFISTASHEMRTPVASIEGYLGLALNPQTAQIDEKARDFINKAHEAAQHLGRLFQDLLDVSKADDNRMKSDPKVVDIVQFMADITEGLQPKAQEKGLSLIFKPRVNSADGNEKGIGRTITPAFYVNVDNSHLREVMDNLVENAIKYTLKGQVAVDVTGDDEKVKVSIADSGIGIPREDLSHLFQKFYRVDNSETREIGGTGLGLYLCRKLVESMNGHIWVESEYQKGSTFFVELPRTSSIEANKLIQSIEQSVARDTTTTSPQPYERSEPSALPSDDLLAAVATASNISPTAPTSLPPVPAQVAPVVAPAPPVVPVAPSQPVAPVADDQQLQSVFLPSVPQTPTTQATPAAPAQVVPVTAPVAPVNPPDTSHIPRPISNYPNTPLSAIEQDPRTYLAQTQARNISVPPRQ